MRLVAGLLAGLLTGMALVPAAQAQRAFGLGVSNYAGLPGVAWNPGTLADSRYRVQVQVFGLDAHLINTAYAYTGGWSGQNRKPDLIINETTLTPQDGQERKLFSAPELLA